MMRTVINDEDNEDDDDDDDDNDDNYVKLVGRSS